MITRDDVYEAAERYADSTRHGPRVPCPGISHRAGQMMVWCDPQDNLSLVAQIMVDLGLPLPPEKWNSYSVRWLVREELWPSLYPNVDLSATVLLAELDDLSLDWDYGKAVAWLN